MIAPLVTIRLAGEPQGKGRPRISTKNGVIRGFTPHKTRAYESALRIAGQDAMGIRQPYGGPLRVVVTASLPIRPSWPKKKQALARAGLIYPAKKPDWDNYAKSLDALNQVVFVDDEQIVHGTVIKEYSDRPELMIEIFEKTGAQP